MTDAPPFCPSCGFNLRVDTAVEIGPWLIATDEVRFHGVRTALTGHETVILHTLAAAYPRSVTNEALANRCSQNASASYLKVCVWRMRQKLGEMCPIETVPGLGYRWAVYPEE